MAHLGNIVAIDTREKRSSAIHVGLPWRTHFPAGDGTINTGDRIQAAGYYRGIEPAAVQGIDFAVLAYTLGERLDFRVNGCRMDYAAGERADYRIRAGRMDYEP